MNSFEVEHPLHGPGRVLSYRRGGRLALVEFQSLPLPTLIPVREFEELQRAPSSAPERTSSKPLGEQTGAAGSAPKILVDPMLTTSAALPIADLAPSPPPPPRLLGSYESTMASMTLEAMRLGVVPATELSAYTVGRDHELSLVDEDFARVDSHGGAMRAFLADYGGGKTHLLELIQHRALKAGFLTATVVLDSRETAPSHPKRVYHALARSLRYPERPYEEGAGLRPLLEKAGRSDEVQETFLMGHGASRERLPGLLDTGMHLYLTPALDHIEALATPDLHDNLRGVDAWEADAYIEHTRDLLMDWIEGHPTVSNREINDELAALPGRGPWVYSMMDYRPWARIYGYLLSGISALAKATGYRGLVLLIDEAELYSLLSSQNRAFAQNLFKALAFASIGDAHTPFERGELDGGGKGVLKDLPPRYNDHPGLYTVLAMTPNEDGMSTLHDVVPDTLATEISAMTTTDYALLVERVADFYASARPGWALPEKFVRQLQSLMIELRAHGRVTNPREAMKVIIELLDLARYHPDKSPQVIARLVNSMMF